MQCNLHRKTFLNIRVRAKRALEAMKRREECTNLISQIELNADATVLDKENGHIVNWLSDLDFEVKQHELSETRAQGTGTWLLDELAFKEWLHGIRRILWCAGDRMFHRPTGFISAVY